MARLPMVTGLVLIALIHATMSISVQEFFPEIKNNLTKIKWAHATNSKALLNDALNSNETMMIEGDVVMGYHMINGSTSNAMMAIMAHPPEDKSDLSLSEFLHLVEKYNKDNKNKTKKGVKLDFKTNDSYAEGAIIINSIVPLQCPVLINADILQGPVNATDQPINAKTFITRAVQAFQPDRNALSIGWTTRYVAPTGNETTTSGNYTTQQIDEMLKLVNGTEIQNLKLNLSITYPVRACYAANSIQALKTLLDKTPAHNNATLTIWTGNGDVVDTDKLSQLIREIGVNKVFVDLPKALFDKLDVNSAFSAKSSVFVVFASMIIALFTAKLL